MNASTKTEVAALQGHDEENCNTSGNPSLVDALDARLSRRNMLRVGMGSAGAALMALPLAACGGGDDAPAAAPSAPGSTASGISLSFDPVAKSIADAVIVPTGYTATVLYALGDPLSSSTPDYRNDGTDTGFAMRAGDHHDGVVFFPLNAAGSDRQIGGSERGVLAMSHEALTDQFLHAAGTTPNPRPPSEADKEVDAHGLSVVEIRKSSGRFSYFRDSTYNRRVTPLTPISMSGPVRGNALLKTRCSPAGTDTRGTINNCGTSYTPWGTFFSGEENWAGYFSRASGDDAVRGGAAARSVASLNRYGKPQNSASRHGWETAGSDDKYLRWNVSQTGASADGTDDYRSEPDTFGYMVQVDPTTRPRRFASARRSELRARDGRDRQRRFPASRRWMPSTRARTPMRRRPPPPPATSTATSFGSRKALAPAPRPPSPGTSTCSAPKPAWTPPASTCLR